MPDDEDWVSDPEADKKIELVTKAFEDFTNTVKAIDPNFFEHPVMEEPGPPLSSDDIDQACTDYFTYMEVSHIWSFVSEMVEKDPERAWPLIVEMIERAPNEDVRGEIAASHLENLVRYHPERMVDRVEHQAIHSKRFHGSLRIIYGWDELPIDVKDRLFAVITPEWEDLADKRATLG